MKKITFALLLVLGVSFSFAQCGKKLTLTSSTTEYLDANNTTERTVDEKSVIKIDKNSVSIAPGAEQPMTGVVKSYSCKWNIPYKEGRSIIKTLMSDARGDKKNATITIEGKGGKVTLLMEVLEMPGKKIRIAIDTFEETK